jgi:hypothetical protein
MAGDDADAAAKAAANKGCAVLIGVLSVPALLAVAMCDGGGGGGGRGYDSARERTYRFGDDVRDDLMNRGLTDREVEVLEEFCGRNRPACD